VAKAAIVPELPTQTRRPPADGGERPPDTVVSLLDERRHDDRPGLQFGDRRWTWRQVIEECDRRAALAAALRQPGPFHIGVLLDNVPEYLLWLGGAAMVGAVVVGINPTRRGAELARDVRYTDCQLIVTDTRGSALLDGLDLGVTGDRVLQVDSSVYDSLLEHAPRAPSKPATVTPGSLFLLLFTSGTTGEPKAVRCTQGRLAGIAGRAARAYGFKRDDVCYCPMPLFHGNAIMALWAPALAVGASVALAGRFSASRFLADVRAYGATRFTYVGKALAYVLATPEAPGDAENTLRQGFGTEASAPDRAAFEQRFGCRVVEGYGSSEGVTSINVTADSPPGSLGLPPPTDDVGVIDPRTMQECPRARIDEAGMLGNPDEAIGEIVNRRGVRAFEGYYKNPDGDAERVHGGWYWTGDLGYRDTAGFFYFAGRSGDWLRVDSENFAAAPIQRIVERHPDIAAAAVYAVPDPRSGDQVMVAVEIREGRTFDPAGFAGFLRSQPDLGTKWAPTFVRVVQGLPVTATGKITTTSLRRQGWNCDDPVFWCADRRGSRYRRLTAGDRTSLRGEFEAHGRAGLLASP
jgi:fatty-acyl-CoA synthase